MHAALLHPLVVLAAEEPEKVNHWLIGGVVLFLLLAALGILLAIGAGREHS